MLSVLRDLARHPGGMPTPELAERHVAGQRTRAAAVSNCGQMMRNLERHGLVRRAGKVRGAVIWHITDHGLAVDAGSVAAPAGELAARARSARREGARAAIAGLRRAGYGPHTPYNLQIVWCHALRASGCTTQQIGDLFGVRRWAITARIGKHPAEVSQRSIRLGTAGSVSVIVSIRQPGAVPGEKLARLWRLVGEIEALGDP
jgi:hypothetical protein